MSGNTERKELRGIAASPGLGIGRAVFLQSRATPVPTNTVDDADAEKRAFMRAHQAVLRETRELYEKTLKKAGKEAAEIIDLHASLLADPEFIDPVLKEISENRSNAALAVERAMTSLADTFRFMDDEYMRARASDIIDIKSRLIARLLGGDGETGGCDLRAPSVIVAADLSPSDTASLDLDFVRGIVSARGGTTSHAAILARMLAIPAVLGVGEGLECIPGDCEILLNGGTGQVVVNPNDADRDQLGRLMRERSARVGELACYKERPTVLKSGQAVRLMANIGAPGDVERALQNGAEGIGLFRSEFLFLNRSAAPSEAQQFEAYRAALVGMKGKPVTIRTLDIGGDKSVPYLNLAAEENPFLGYRAIRLCLGKKELFLTQLRALLRAGTTGNLHVMFPMICSLEELRRAKAVVDEAKEELRRRAEPFAEDLKIGIMIETPAAALLARPLARECDFFSIGTNDLIQYTLAVDRGNKALAELYSPYHPAVLSLIRMTAQAAAEAGIPCGMCGEAAGDGSLIPLLIGSGLSELSMNAGSILEARRDICALTMEEAERLAGLASDFDSATDIRSFLQRRREERESGIKDR